MGTIALLLNYRRSRITCTTFVGIKYEGTFNTPRISQSIQIIDAQIIAVSMCLTISTEKIQTVQTQITGLL